MPKLSNKKFRERLVEMVKAAGQDIIDQAEDLVGTGDMMCNFDISVHFGLDDGMLNGCPTIEVTREHIAKNSCDVLFREDK